MNIRRILRNPGKEYRRRKNSYFLLLLSQPETWALVQVRCRAVLSGEAYEGEPWQAGKAAAKGGFSATG